jgi:5-oxoprolinase (ATP-hydrolysing)
MIDPAPYPRVRVCIDRGGTFTDVYATVVRGPSQPVDTIVLKLLSVDSASYPDAPTEGIRRVLARATGHSSSGPVDTTHLDEIRMGTTVATNALLERDGEPTAFVTTAGLRDVLEIGRQARPDIFDLKVVKPPPLYEAVVEAKERVRVMRVNSDEEDEGDGKKGSGGAIRDAFSLQVETPLDKAALRTELRALREKGLRSLAVALMHSYGAPEHEREVEKIAREEGFEHVSVSSALTPMVKIVARGYTAVVDAYLTPKIRDYISSFRRGFKDELRGVRVQFMRSDGGLCSMDEFSGYLAILSGPAGGVVGFSKTAYMFSRHLVLQETTSDGRLPEAANEPQPVIGFDMGGTSTDVSRYAGRLEHVFETEIAGVMIQAPQLDITTVAAGGGSRLFYRAGMFAVGPESAGASPGPVCYRKGGHLAVTDANLLLGRVIPELFPNIFGPNADEPLDVKSTQAAFTALAASINLATAGSGAVMTPEEVALGFVEVANEAMCRPIRQLTEAKGHDVRKHVLACFGGAGGQHACAIARSLGIKTVFVHKHSGILSAYGIALADSVTERQQPLGEMYAEAYVTALRILDEAAAEAASVLEERGFRAGSIRIERYLNLRYDGTNFAIMVDGETASRFSGSEEGSSDGSKMSSTHPTPNYGAAFVEMYHHEHGFTIPNRAVVIDDVRVRALGVSASTEAELAAASMTTDGQVEGGRRALEPLMTVNSYFAETGGFTRTAVYRRESLQIGGARAVGPAVVVDSDATVVVEPGCVARVTATGDLVIDIDAASAGPVAAELRVSSSDPLSVDRVRLSVMGHRFMGIAEQMGRTLQRTAISTNIKERLDFSCALFSPNGSLVANAPHIPVHLGSMQDAVRYQSQLLGSSWKAGEVLLCNHPIAGGTHLPDVTVITPVYFEGVVVFYVASRGHQADIGGIAPGSMPPFSRSLSDEGMAVESLKIVTGGVFQESLLLRELERAGGRCNDDVISDIRAQVAANKKGISLVEDLIKSERLETVHAYMGHIQTAAADAVRSLLRRVSEEKKLAAIGTLRAEDSMDDGTSIQLALTINRDAGTAVFDFEGTGLAVAGNTNAPRAIAYSAVIYTLRCLVAEAIPMNQGCLDPVTIKLPKGILLNPGPTCAVAGGNVLTSQRITDVILRAFGACAASQGCMGNFSFGNASMGYYETIAGGSGAGPGWHGTSGVQCHMTNTQATDSEILERRYPAVVRQFGLRTGSGGAGKWRGGDGVVRTIEFSAPVTASILTERRVYPPWGGEGGGNGQRGSNTLIKADGSMVNLTGKNTVDLEAGDAISICTPGGGGWGI